MFVSQKMVAVSLTTMVFAVVISAPTRAQTDDLELLTLPAMLAANSRTGSNTLKPGPNNTGFQLNPKVVVQSDSIKVTEDGAVLKDIDLTGCIDIAANNVVLQNIRINCSGLYGIHMNSGFENLLIEDVEIFGPLSSGILGSHFTVRRANIHDSGSDAVKAGSNVLIENSWMHKLGTKPMSHSDGVQMVKGDNVVIRGNNIDMPHFLSGYTNSQCMIIQTNIGTIDNILIEGNWLNGGGYCVQINDKGNGYGPPTNVRIIDNKFGPDCNFGIFRFRDSSPLVSGNIYEESGEPIGTDFTLCGNDFEQ